MDDKIKVGVIGYNLIGKRVVDAITLQKDMEVSGVFGLENDTLTIAEIKGHKLFDELSAEFCETSDIIVNCGSREQTLPQAVRVINVQFEHDAKPAFGINYAHEMSMSKIAEPNNVAILRIIKAFGASLQINRLYTTNLNRSENANIRDAGPIDSILPVFDKTKEQEELERLLGEQIEIFSQHLTVSHTNSNVVTMKCDLENMFAREDIIALLNKAPRIVVAAGGDGFKDTAHIQEYYRDLGRPRFDRPEIFLWEENILTEGKQLYLMADVSPEATVIPEIIDTIRLTQTTIDLDTCVFETNNNMGIN